jgi:SAM-dependent methyltransferase
MNIFIKKFPIAYIGLNPMRLFRFIKSIPRLITDYLHLKKQLIWNNDFKISRMFLIAEDKTDNSGSASWHYFHQDLLVAQQIFQNNPQRHIDIWSRVDWFVTHVASFRKIDVLDIRPLDNKVENINFIQCDLMWDCIEFYESTDSISCLHTIEHFWLWRYWDTIDANGHIKWLENMYNFLKKWWLFYFSTPIWPQRIEFNAHRVFDINYLIQLFKNKYTILSFSYVDDNWDLHKNIDLTNDMIKNNCWCIFWCWIFELKKI